MKIVYEAMKFAEEIFKNEYSGHDYFHTIRVYNMATKIAEREHADMFIVQLSALLHDVDDLKLFPENHRYKNNAVNFLHKHNIPEDMIHGICQIIDEVDFLGEDSKASTTIEGRCVQDADRLDALGAIGIARAFTYGGNHNMDIYNPDIKPRLTMSAEEYREYQKGNIPKTTISHFYEKLFKLESLMTTEMGKKLAIERTKYMRQFVTKFFDEWEGII